MGNWGSVHIVGSCPPEQVKALQDAITVDIGCFDQESQKRHGPLCYWGHDGICGLNDWTGQIVNKVGNLAERDYGVEDVAEHLTRLLVVAPGLDVAVHCGGDYEDKACIATVRAQSGQVTIRPPEIEQVPKLTENQLTTNLFAAMASAARRRNQ